MDTERRRGSGQRHQPLAWLCSSLGSPLPCTEPLALAAAAAALGSGASVSARCPSPSSSPAVGAHRSASGQELRCFDHRSAQRVPTCARGTNKPTYGPCRGSAQLPPPTLLADVGCSAFDQDAGPNPRASPPAALPRDRAAGALLLCVLLGLSLSGWG